MKDSLWEVEQQFQAMFEFAPTGMAMLVAANLPSQTISLGSMTDEANLEWRFTQTNPAFTKILGYTGEELQNRSFTEFTHPDDRAESLKQLEKLLLGQRTNFSLEKRYAQKNGHMVWVNVSVSVVFDANGLLQDAIATIQDIRERKQTDLDLQQAHDQLERRVSELTAKLAKANKLLKQEMAECQQTQEALKSQQVFIQNLIDVYPERIFAKGSFAIATDIHALEAIDISEKESETLMLSW